MDDLPLGPFARTPASTTPTPAAPAPAPKPTTNGYADMFQPSHFVNGVKVNRSPF